jgi:hypothetical protein
MVNYNNGKIYKIEAINGEDGDIYIGSTTKEYLSQRMTRHRNAYNFWLKGNNCSKITSYILFEKFGMENCRIVLIENVNATSSDELRARETFYIKLLSCVNKNIPMRSQKEYNVDNKEKIKETKKLYDEKHKEQIRETSKKFRENNIEKEAKRHSKYYIDNKDELAIKSKIFRENNKDEIAKKFKIFYDTNKEKINKATNLKRSIKCKCECGLIIPECRKTEHIKTKNHIKIMESFTVEKEHMNSKINNLD